jgi:hypothetical protein
MTKKTAKPKAKGPETKTTEAEPTTPRRAHSSAPHHVVAGGLPRFNFDARPITNEEVRVSDTPTISPSYESIQQQAKGPGVEKWRRIDKLRTDLTNLYNSLQEDTRYTEEHKAHLAWSEYERVRTQIEQLAPEAHKEMSKSAEGLERMSIPVPEGEGLRTKDTSKLLLTASKRSRLEGLISRQEKVAEKRPFKPSPIDILKTAYEQGLDEGGPGGGATVRAVIQLARDYGFDLDEIVDKAQKASSPRCS